MERLRHNKFEDYNATSTMPNGGLKKRKNLWSRGRYCYWCGRLTKVRPLNPLTLKVKLKENEATIDHLYHRGHPLRAVFPSEKVLACYRCNQDRNKIWFYVYAPLFGGQPQIKTKKKAVGTPFKPNKGKQIIIKEVYNQLQPEEVEKIVSDYYERARRRIRIKKAIACLNRLIPKAKDWKTTQEYMRQRYRLVQILEHDLARKLTTKHSIKS